MNKASVIVAAAVIMNDSGQVLLAKRPDHLHQGGLWEFPGGKLERGESSEQALARELMEELGIEVVDSHPFIGVRHQYPDKCVCLDVWQVTRFEGQPHGRESQLIRWVECDQLPQYDFPVANKPIVDALMMKYCAEGVGFPEQINID